MSTSTIHASDTATAAAATMTPAPAPAKATTLANAGAAAQASAIRDALACEYQKVAAAALAEAGGSTKMALSLVGPSVIASVTRIAQIIPILRSAAPAGLFVDGNNRGVRIGELYASRLGLGNLYRENSRGDLKAARAALREDCR